MHFRLLPFVVFAVLVASACSTPLALRGARVMEKGEFEVLASGQLQTVSAFAAAGGQAVATPPATFPWVEASVRLGLVDRVDLQLRFDPALLPEIDIGYQLVGDPTRDDDLAVTVTGGVKASFFSTGGAGVLYVNLPLQLLVDLPIGESFGLMGGLRVIPNALFGFAGGVGGAGTIGAAPGAVVGVRLKIGGFVLSPEFALASNFPFVGGASSSAGTASSTLGVGAFSGTIGFNIGGQFGTPERAASSSSSSSSPPPPSSSPPPPPPPSSSPSSDAAPAPPSDAASAPPAPLDPATPY